MFKLYLYFFLSECKALNSELIDAINAAAGMNQQLTGLYTKMHKASVWKIKSTNPGPGDSFEFCPNLYFPVRSEGVTEALEEARLGERAATLGGWCSVVNKSAYIASRTSIAITKLLKLSVQGTGPVNENWGWCDPNCQVGDAARAGSGMVKTFLSQDANGRHAWKTSFSIFLP